MHLTFLSEHCMAFLIVSIHVLLINGNKPKLNVISRKTALVVFNDRTSIDVKVNSTLRLRCEGMQSINWTFPQSDPDLPSISSLVNIKSKCNKNKKPVCISDMTLNDISFWQTGLYSCHHNISNKILSDSIYVFVNDADNLIVPYQGSDEFIIVPVHKNTSNLIIPCKPTNSKATATLLLYDMQTENFMEMSNKMTKFDPTVGFYVNNFVFTEYTALDCKVKLGKNEQFVSVTLYDVSPNNRELFPFIEVSPNITKVGDDVTLNCSVHIEGNAFIDITWDFETNVQHNNQRISESSSQTVTTQTSGGVFETVSRMLTIRNVTHDDSGLYVCNITDFGGHVYSDTKQIIIRDGFMIKFIPFKSKSHQLSPKHFILYICFLIIIKNIFS